MTTFAAIKKGKRLCLACDGMGTYGSRKEVFGKHVQKTSKIFEIGPNIIGISGHASWELVISNYFNKYKTVPVLETVDQVFEMFNEIHQVLKNKFYFTPPYLDYLPFESSEFQALLINVCGIFEVEHSRMVRHYTKYSAIGTGEDYALGAISALYDIMDNPEDIARIAIEAAAQFDKKTGLPIQTRCIYLK